MDNNNNNKEVRKKRSDFKNIDWNEYRRTKKVNCPCGQEVFMTAMWKHKQSRKHLLKIKDQKIGDLENKIVDLKKQHNIEDEPKKEEQPIKEEKVDKRAERVTCDCGKVLRRDSMFTHEGSKQHKEYLKNKK